MGRQTAAEFSGAQLAPVSTFSVQAGKAKIVLSVLKNHASIRVKIRSVTPDLTEVGGTLEEAKGLRQENDELTLKLDEKQAEIITLLTKLEGKEGDDTTRQKVELLVKDAWKDIGTQLEQRKALLDQSVAFHASALQFGKKMSQVEARCAEVPQAEDVETARRLIQQHQELKKGVLEASMSTLQEGQLLLDRIRRMALCADVTNRHATTSGCYAIEQLLLNLQDRKRRLEELWLQRKFQLEQCIQLLLLDQEASKVTKWLDEVGEIYLAKKDLGDSFDSSNNLLNDCITTDHQFLAAPPTVRRLIGAIEYLTHPVPAEKDSYRQRFVALDQRCESFTSRLNARRKNISLSAYFFALAQETSLRLEEIEVLLSSSDPGSDQNALAERHSRLLQSIVEASIAALHVGRSLLGRVGKDDPAGTGVNTKVTEIQERCNKLQSLCTAKPTPEKQQSEAITGLLDKFNKFNAWIKYVGQASLDRYSELGIGVSDANDFLITHRGLSEEYKAKQTEAKAILSSAEELAKSGDAVATDLLEKSKRLAEQLENLIQSAEKRSKIALAYVVLNRREQQLSTQLRLLEDHLKQEKLDPSLIPEAAIRQREEAFKKVTADCVEIDRIGKQFLTDINELKTTDQLNTEFVVRGVSLMVSNFADRKEIVSDFFERWNAYAVEGRTFSTQWKQFVQDARKTIDWVMKVEDGFFPKIAGELGSTLGDVQQHQKRLEDFKPTIKKAHEETEKHLKTAELLSLKGDTRGQRDQIVNELLKVHSRFQARTGEYRYLLNIATKFFENLQELDKLIATTEKEYSSEELPKDVSAAETTLRQHNDDRAKLKQLIEFSSEEADQIIIRVRQQDSEEVAKDEVQKVLQLSEEKRMLWEKAWDDHKKRLEQCLQVSQFYFDLKQLQDELDEILRQLDARQGSYGNSLASVKMIIQAFVQLEKLADLIGERFKDFAGTADKMIKDRHYDSRRIRHEMDETEKRWNTVYNTIKSYRISLEASIKFFNIMDESEGWITDAGQFLHGISKQAPQCKSSADVDKLIGHIQKYKLDGAALQDGRLNNMERIATDLYGSVVGPEKMQHILDKNQEMFNSFIKAIEDLMILRNNLINTEQILANVGAVVEKKAPRQPRFVQPLQNAEITEGQKFTFECRLECDTLAPHVHWLKDNEPVKGVVPSYKDGICRLTIEETMLRDSGSFTCKAITEAGSAETSATLKVKGLQQKVVSPEFSKQLKPLEVPEGTSCFLECYVSGIPFPTISWFKDDAPVSNSAEHLIVIDGGCCYLKIRKLNKDHSGVYKCKAANPGGEAVTSASVNVISVKKPEFTQPLKDAKVDEGKSIHLECRYTGDPAPQIQWLFNDAPILPSALFKIIVEENFTALEIHEVFSEDCGNYTATAKNLGGEARTTCLLSLIGVQPGVAADTGKRPEFVQRLQRHDVQEGTRAKLECLVTGIPEPEVLWYHNDKPIKKSKDFEISYQGGRCTLAINEVYLEDSGEYLCTARNVHGMARTECRLVVEPLSELSDTGASLTGEVPPKFTQLLKDIEGVAGELVRFECRVIGHPTPIIKWYCGRNQLSTSPEFEIVSERELQTLTIPTVHKDDAGNYMVKATNNAGIAKCYATLIVKEGGDKHAMKMRLIESSHSVQTNFIEGHRPPEVVKAFHDLHVRPGQPCTMEVVIVGTPRPKIQWLFNNEPIVSPDYKISALGDVHSLHIPEVFDEDAGRFSVIAENDAGKAWCSALLVVVDMSQLLPDEGSPPETPLVQQAMKLGFGPPPVVPMKAAPQFHPPAEAHVAPRFPEPLKNVSAEEGFSAVFEILVSGKPEPVIRWFKDGRQLIAGTGGLEIFHRDGRATLIIPNVSERDAGSYTCTSGNVAGEVSSTAQLTVKAALAQPKFIQKLEAQNVREGESVTFRVRVSGKPPPQVSWFREGAPIVSSPDFNISQDGDVHTLYIPEVFKEDSGRFTVRVTSLAGQSESSADLIIEGAKETTFTAEKSFDLTRKGPWFVRPLTNRTVQVGQRVTIECAIPPYPAPEKVQWFHNEIEIFISPQHQISYANGSCLLSITKVVPESHGRYACTVLINGLSSTTDMNLDVVGEPEREPQIPQFGDKLKHIKYEDGQEVVFVCQVAGFPPPLIQWFHNGRLVRPSKKHEMKLTKEGVCSLRINAVGPDDVGIYTCSATNVMGQEYSSAELYVPDVKTIDETSYVSPEALRRMTYSPGRGLKDRDYGGVSEQFFKPVFRKVPNDLEVPEGGMARFDSIVAGRPIPDMLWFREGTQVHDDRLHKIVINEEGINSLIIDATSASDAGQYTCIARNRAGEDSFQVHLNILPRQSAAPPRFLARLNNQTVVQGQSVTFVVEVEGIPPPIVSWQKDGHHITSSDHYQISNEGFRSTLYIPMVRPDDNAWFQCTAASGGGIATNRVRLVVEAAEPQIQVSQRTFVQSASPAPRKIPTPVGRHAPSPDFRQQTVNVILAPSPGPRASPWQQQQQYAEEVMSRTALEMQTKRTEFSVSSEAAPQLIEPMKDQQVVEGVSTLFNCRIYSATEPRHEWFFNNRQIHPSQKYRFTAENGVYALAISGISQTDAGVYKCVVSNQGGEVTCIAHLRVGTQLSRLTPAEHVGAGSQAPHFVKSLGDIATTVGGSASFNVSIGGQSPSDVQWFVNGHPIQPSENFQVLRSNGTYTLRIKTVTPNDIGVYTCRVITPLGVIDSSARLTIQTRVDAGADLTDSKSFPAAVREQEVVPEIVPSKKVSPLPVLTTAQSPPEDSVVVAHGESTATVTTHEVVVEEVVKPVIASPRTITVPDLSAVGQRTETSVVGHRITEVKGVTTVVEVSQGDAPRFTRPIQPCVVVEGQSCTFSAVVTGDPWPEITWLKEKEEFAKTERHKTTANVGTGSCSLTIVDCQPSDTGVYSCRATNAAGRATCTANIVVVPPNVEVTVTEKTMSVKKEKVTTMGDQEIRVVENSPTFKEALPPVVEVNEGEPVRLQCQIGAEPEPSVSWFFNGNQMTSTHRVTLTFDKVMTVLAIPSTTLADTGEYICTAKNPLGEAHTKTFLRIKKLDKEPVPAVPATRPTAKPSTELYTQPIVPGSAVEVSLPMPPMALTEPCSVIPLSSPKPEAPKFSMPLRNHTVREGDAVKFDVQFTGNPTPNVTWYINGRPVREDGDFHVTVDADRGESTLTIREVFSDDEGEFTCKAVNSVGTALSNSHLFIIVSSDEERRSTEKTTVEQEIVINRELLKNLRNQQETIIVEGKPRTQVVELVVGSNNYQSTLETNIHRDDSEMKNHFIPIPVREKRDQERSIYIERNTQEQRQFTEVIEGDKKMFSETVAIDRSDQRPETVEFELKSEVPSKTSELVVHTKAMPKGMKMEHLLLLERNVKKHEIQEALVASQIFSETVAIDTSDHKPQTLEFELKQLKKSSELLVHQKALPKGVRMEAEILESLRKTSRLDLSRSKYIEAVENQRQEFLLNLEGSPPKFTRELEPQKVMDGDKTKFNARVIGNPMPEEVTWYHDGKLIADNPDFHMEYDSKTGDTSLFIGELFPQDAGSYTCLAKNIYGQATISANLIVEAYEYMPDSEASYASQTESNISTSSAMESLQRMRVESQQFETKFKQEVVVEKITERREEEYIHIADVKWCQPKYTEPTVETVGHENVTEISIESRGVTVDQTAIPQITTQITVQASRESRIHPLQESTTVEDVREFDYTDSAESRLKESGSVTSPLATPATWKKPEARVSVQLEHFREEALTGTEVGMASPEIPISLAISELEQVKVAKTVGTVFVKPGQLPAEPLEATDTIQAVSFESGNTEEIRSTVDTAKTKDVPSSWTMIITSQQNQENVEHLKDEVPSPQITKEEEILGALIKTTAHKEHTLVSQVVEFHSEGEEEELFHEAVEPSPRSSEVTSESLVNISVLRRPFSLAAPLVAHQTVESTTAEIGELIKENPRGEEIKVSLDSAFRKLPVPFQTRPIQELVQVNILREEDSSLNEVSKMSSQPEVVSAEFEKTRREENPVSWVSFIEDRLSPEKTIVVQSNNYDELSMILPKPDLIRVELVSSSVEKKTVTRVQTMEDGLRFEVSLDAASSRVEDLSVVLPVPEVISVEFSSSSKQDKPVTRTQVIEDRTSVLNVNELNSQGVSEEVCQESFTAVELDKAAVAVARPSLVRVQEEQVNILGTAGLDSQITVENSRSEFIESLLVNSLIQPQPYSLVRVTEERASQEDVLCKDDHFKDITMMVSAAELITLELVSSSREEKPVNRATLIEDRLSPEKTVVVTSVNLDELSVVLPSTEVIETKLGNSQIENIPTTRVSTLEERVPVEAMSEQLPSRAEDMAMTLPTPELIYFEFSVSNVEGKTVSRVLTTEDRLSPDRVTSHQAVNLNDLALTLAAGRVTSTQFASSTHEDIPVSRTVVSEDVNLAEDVEPTAKQNLANLIMMISAAEVESVDLVPVSKDGKPVTQVLVQEERPEVEKVSERQAVKTEEHAMTLPGSKVVSVELESSVQKDRLVSKVVAVEDKTSLENVSDVPVKGTADISFTVTPRLEPSVEFESKVGDYVPVTQTRTVEEHNETEDVSEKKTALDELLVTAFTSLFAGVELASALRDFLLSQVQVSEEQTYEEKLSEKCSSMAELLVSALSSQISAADLVFAVRERLLSQVRLSEDRKSPERVEESCSDTKNIMVTASSSQISATDLAFALHDGLISQVKMLEERFSPERVLERSSNTSDLLVNALSSQTSSEDFTQALRERLVLQVRLMEERMSPERIFEKSSNTNEIMVTALSSKVSAADLTFASRAKQILQTKLIEERMSPERTSEKNTSTAELIVNALSSQISAAELAFGIRERLISQVRLIEERKSPERIFEKTSCIEELLVNALSTQISAAEFAHGIRERLISQVRLIEERKSPERIFEKTSCIEELLVNALSTQISAAEFAHGIRERLISQVRLVDERISPERVSEKTSSTSELYINAMSSQTPDVEITPVTCENVLSLVQTTEERKSPERITDCVVGRVPEQSGTVSEVQTSVPFVPFVQKDRSHTLVLPQVIRLHVEAANKLESPTDEEAPFTSETESLLSRAAVFECPVYLNEEISEDKEIVTEITYTIKKEPETKKEEFVEEVTKVQGPHRKEITTETEIETVMTVEEWEIVDGSSRKDSERSNSETGSIDEEWENTFTTETTTEKTTEVEKSEPENLMETGSMLETWEETITKEITTEKDLVTEKREPEIGNETEDMTETWEETVTKEITTEKDLITEKREPEIGNETEDMTETWEETITKEITTEKDLVTEKREPENGLETEDMTEEWVETITKEIITERDIVVKQEKEEPEHLSETESLVEEWEETLTTETTTETDVVTTKKEPETEDLSETESLFEEWEETLKTTTITEKDVIVTKEKEPERLSESESFNEEWEETLKTETTTETDVVVEKPESDRESLSETESMYEEWAETKKTITIVERDIILGEMERVKVSKTGVVVCKEIRQGKETAEEAAEGVDVTDSQVEKKGTIGEHRIETQTTYQESGPISREHIEFRSNIPLVVPAVEVHMQPITVADGSMATLSCQVAGYPISEIKWYVDGMEIKQSSDFKMTYENGFCQLVINDVLPEDEGEYCMTASNAVGTCRSSAYLKVRHSNTSTTSSRQKEKARKTRYSSGEEMYSSGEESSQKWAVEENRVFDEFNSVVIDVALKRKGIVDSKYEWLQEQSVRQGRGGLETSRLGNDEFDYDMSHSGFEMTEGQTSFKQVVASSRAAQTPVFIAQLESRDVFESTPVKLECDVKGFPQPEITWYQDGKKIQPNNHMKLGYNHGRCSLMIDRVTIDDEAEYVCEARNEHGVATTWAELLVEKLIEGLEQLVMEEFYELEIEMQFKWKPRTDEINEQETTA